MPQTLNPSLSERVLECLMAATARHVRGSPSLGLEDE